MSSPFRPASAIDTPLAGARVLVIDDHSFTIRLVKDVLYACGVGAVHTALDGGEGVAMLRSVQPQLVVTDWRMPGLDGLAMTRLIREAALTPDARIPDPQVPIVLLSAHTSARAVETARRAGVNEVVVKPFTIAALLQKMQAAISQPRPFVVCNTYIGPDRRRRADTGPGAVHGRRLTDLARPEPLPISATKSVLKLLQAELDELDRPLKAARGRRR